MNKTIRLDVLIQNVNRLDKAEYWNWEGGYDRAIGLETTAKKELGEAFYDVIKARVCAAEFTGETTYKPICDRLRAMGYTIIKDDGELNAWREVLL